MENKKALPSGGDIRQLWAETFDKEMGRFLLMPIDNLTCGSCPGNHHSEIHGRRTVFTSIKELKDKIRLRIWLCAVNWLEDHYSCTDAPYSSQITDGCLAIKEGLSNGSPNKTRP